MPVRTTTGYARREDFAGPGSRAGGESGTGTETRRQAPRIKAPMCSEPVPLSRVDLSGISHPLYAAGVLCGNAWLAAAERIWPFDSAERFIHSTMGVAMYTVLYVPATVPITSAKANP